LDVDPAVIMHGSDSVSVQTLGNSLSEHPGIDLASVIGKRLLQDAAAKEILPGVCAII
jgi:hypothetical protein